jgi:hypothetical protein
MDIRGRPLLNHDGVRIIRTPETGPIRTVTVRAVYRDQDANISPLQIIDRLANVLRNNTFDALQRTVRLPFGQSFRDVHGVLQLANGQGNRRATVSKLLILDTKPFVEKCGLWSSC